MATNDAVLTELQPAFPYFVGIDSDGCVFDTMEIKHKECFAPMFIKHFHLQAVSRYAREVWEFVNLYSKSRGINRFPALSNALNLLAERPETEARGIKPWTTDALDEWISREKSLSNAALEAEIDRGNPTLEPVLAWSRAVNASIEDIVHGVPPFPYVTETLQRLSEVADIAVVSQTPTPALQREWTEHNIASFARVIAGQELGSKSDHLRLAAGGGKYAPKHVLMIGDAPGDFKAARANHALFFPIIPGREEQSWQRLYSEALDLFLAGDYPAHEAGYIEEFNASLPEHPHWHH